MFKVLMRGVFNPVVNPATTMSMPRGTWREVTTLASHVSTFLYTCSHYSSANTWSTRDDDQHQEELE
jgi:hypothetical protein